MIFCPESFIKNQRLLLNNLPSTKQNMQLQQISKDLNLPEEEIIEQGVRTFLDRELKNASLEMNKFKLKYGVISPQELEQKIKLQKIAEHPGWDDLMEWENLQQRVELVKKWMQKLYTAS